MELLHHYGFLFLELWLVLTGFWSSCCKVYFLASSSISVSQVVDKGCCNLMGLQFVAVEIFKCLYYLVNGGYIHRGVI